MNALGRPGRRGWALLWACAGPSQRAAFRFEFPETVEVLLGRVHRVVYSVERHVKEERVGAVVANKLHGFPRKQLGGVLAVFENLGAVPPEVVVIHGARIAPIITMRVIIDASGMKAKEAIEAVSVGYGVGGRSQVPLPD